MQDQVTYFEDWGVDDALEQISSDVDKHLFLSPRWSISEESSTGQALYIRDNSALNARYKLTAGKQVDIKK